MANVGFISVQQGEQHGASPSSPEGPLLMYPFWKPQWQRRCLHQPKAAVSGRAGQDSGVRLNSIRALSSSYPSGLDLLLLVVHAGRGRVWEQLFIFMFPPCTIL